jgi:hypothetical protein
LIIENKLFPEKPKEKKILVRSPGFEPEYPAWEAGVLTRLDYDRLQSL